MAGLSSLTIRVRYLVETDELVSLEFTGPRGDGWIVGYFFDDFISGEEWKRPRRGSAG